MAAVRTQQSAAHEIWVETNPANFTGVTPPTVVTTAIRATAAELNQTRIRLYLHDVAGVPVVLPPTAALVPDPSAPTIYTVLQATFQNTSGNPADQASWKLEVERIWSASR